MSNSIFYSVNYLVCLAGGLLNFVLNEKTEGTQILIDIFFAAFFSESWNLNHEFGKG